MEWQDIAVKGIEMAYDQATSAQQMQRSKKLMEIQQQHQMALNKQGQELQLQTWEQTNYPAQVAMLKEAGLNPGLLYGKGGSGGVTGSQSGGSASMAQAPSAKGMDINNILAYSTQQANIQLMKAEADKAKAEAEKLRGVDTTKTETEIGKIIAETSNEQLKGELIKVQTGLEAIKMQNEQSQIDASLKLIGSQIANLQQQNALTAEQFTSLVKEAAAKATGQILENELTESKINLTDAEKKAVITAVVQKWTELSIEGKKLEQKDLEIAIETFKAEIGAEYPGVWNVAGSILKKAYKSLENMTQYGPTGLMMPQKDQIKK